MRRKISTLGFLAIISIGSLQTLAQVNREQKVDIGAMGFSLPKRDRESR